LVGRLYRDRGIQTLVHGVSLVHASPIEIIKAHQRAHMSGVDLDVSQTVRAVEVVKGLELGSVSLDVGRLLGDFSGNDLTGHVTGKLAPFVGDASKGDNTDVVLYGFGRIGRILARLLLSAGAGSPLRLRAIVVRKKAEDDLPRRANLLRRDSIHGQFEGTVNVLSDESSLLINGQKVRVIYASSPDQVDYTQYGIRDALVVDNTGKWRDRKGLGLHLAGKGVGKVILTAPAKDDIPNIVYGVNQGELRDDERIISAASCTTNAITPVLKVMNDRYGIRSGHLETVHAFTNDQNLIDNYHKKARRGRSAALNMVITTTGAASAVAKALPALAGKLSGSAIRVPTPDVSLAVINLRLEQAATRDEINDYLREVATQSDLKQLVGWTANSDIVSSDLVGDSHAGVVDAGATVTHENTAVVYVWYDNEWGYSVQVMRLLGHCVSKGLTRVP
jgi:glyceraldehyde 3-phosphate dehydrogenase